MANQKSPINPMTIYMTFGLVAAVSLIMSTFIGSGMALWYPSLTKPDFSIPLAFTFIIRTFLAVMFGFLLYFAYTYAGNMRDKWIGFFYSVFVFFLNELFYVLFFHLQNISFYFFAQSLLFILSVGLVIFFVKCNKKAIWTMIPFLVWLMYQIPWAYTLWKLNA